MAVPADTLVPLPDEVSFTAGAAMACGTGTAFQALRRLVVGPGETVAVFGLGPVGLSAIQFAASMGARVIGVDPVAERRSLAESMGADVTVDPADGDSVEALWDLTGGRGAACGLDATGNATARNQMVRSLGTWGRGCFVGEGGDVTLDVSDDLLRRQITLHGSWTFSTAGVAECARYVARHGIDVDMVFTHTWALDDAPEAFRLFDAQVGAKAVILPNG
jgi:threonine dehydrogenase-like Zn-dependent dehydrogenase